MLSRFIYKKWFERFVIHSTESWLLESRQNSLMALDNVVDVNIEIERLKKKVNLLEREAINVRAASETTRTSGLLSTTNRESKADTSPLSS